MPKYRRIARDKTGAAALEFAIISPLFLLVLLSLIAYGIYLSAAHSVQQITSDAARSAVAGLNNAERQKLARDFITTSTLDHAFLEKNRFTINVAEDARNPNQFTVSVDYNAENLPIWNLFTFALPEKNIHRFSTIRIGGI